MTEQQIIAELRERADKLGGIREAARQWGISASYLSGVLGGRIRPGVSVVEAIGYRREISYVKTR